MENRFTLNKNDWQRIVKNAIIFFAPALLIFLTVIQNGGSIETASVALQTWALNTAIDVIRKFIAESK